MKCLDCHGRLRVTHTHSTDRARASRAVCEGCGNVFTLATTVLRGERRGSGAKALAGRLRAGTARVELVDDGEAAVQETDEFTVDEQAE